MSAQPVDDYGRAKIALDETHNRPGFIEIDGDIWDTGRVACIAFELDSEPQDVLDRLEPNQEIQFGTFRLKLTGSGRIHANAILGEGEVRAIVAALLWQIGETYERKQS